MMVNFANNALGEQWGREGQHIDLCQFPGANFSPWPMSATDMSLNRVGKRYAQMVLVSWSELVPGHHWVKANKLHVY